MTKDGKKARSAIIANVADIENENVLRSIFLILGDYKVRENADERADYITPILYRLVTSADCEILKKVFLFVDAICKDKN